MIQLCHNCISSVMFCTCIEKQILIIQKQEISLQRENIMLKLNSILLEVPYKHRKAERRNPTL